MKYYLPAIIWAILIWIVSTGPGVSLPASWWDVISVDKWAHAFVYGVLTLLILWGLQKRRATVSSSTQWMWVVVSSAYGILLEVVQYSFFPNRYFEVLDILANIIGSLLGLYIFRKFFIFKT